MVPRDRAVSPVVGGSLLLVVVLLLAVLVGAMVTGFTVEEPAPQASLSTSFEVTADPDTNTTTQHMVLENTAGETIDPDDLRVIVDAGTTSLESPPRVNGGSLSAGTAIKYNLTSAGLCSADASSATVKYVHEPSEKLVAESTVRIERNATFSIESNSVGSNAPYRAEVTIPGSGYATLEHYAGTDYYLYWPFESRITISGAGSQSTLTPFPDGDPHDALSGTPADDVNDPAHAFPMTYTTDVIQPEKNVTVEMRSYTYEGHAAAIEGRGTIRTFNGDDYEEAHVHMDHEKRTIESSDPDEENVRILRDGDSLPSWGASSPHQDSLQDLLGHRTDGSGTLQLGDDEFVAVYELNEPADSGDFNDAVAIIELHPQPTVTETKRGRTLFCG